MQAVAERARAAGQKLAASTLQARNQTLTYIREELVANKADILVANQKDCSLAGDKNSPLYKRLLLSESKFSGFLEGLDEVIGLPDPLGKIDLSRDIMTGLHLQRISCSIGVLLTIYESRPEAGVQIASLALKSGNGLILKGGKEAHNSNAAIFHAISKALTKANAEFDIPIDALQLVETRQQVSELLTFDNYIDLVIPRGSNALVRAIKESTKIAVLGHADGICKLFVDEDFGDLQKAVKVVVDAKTNYPAACNAIETLLVHEKSLATFLPPFAEATKPWSVKFIADEQTAKYLPADRTEPATEEDWHKEYLDNILAVKTVKNINEAIDHINTLGSSHTDCIISANPDHIKEFQAKVDSSGVYANCSTRFADGFRYGFGAEIGISTNRMHPRGPVGVEGLVLYKYLLNGDGHTVEEFNKHLEASKK